jgi:adenylate kinase family enzyme
MHNKDIMYKLDHGMFVDDDTMNSLMSDVMRRAHARGTNRVVLDGFPSSYRQVRWMIDNKEISNLTGAIILRVPHGELWKRLMERKRVDDTRAAIERREDLYDRSITGMIRALSMEDVLVREVNGMGTPEDVLERISEILGEWNLVPRKQYKDISRNIKINYTSRV